MAELQAIGVRLDKLFLKKVEALSREEHLDRSTALRVLMEEGYMNFTRKKAAQLYKEGKITISKAAEKAGITVWEMEQFLTSQGFKSQYSIEDLKEELDFIQKIK